MIRRFLFLNCSYKFLAICLLALAFHQSASAQCSGGSPKWTTTIDQSSVNNCISSASSGDTITVSSGSASWSSVTIPGNKGLTLQCVSPLACNVTGSSDGYLTINAGNTATGSVVTGFNFSGGGNGIWIYLATAPPYYKAPRFYNNTMTGSGTQFNVSGFGPALVDHNILTAQADAEETIHLWGGGAGCSACWDIDVVPGSANMTFFENNSWKASSGYCQFHEAYYGAVVVDRYNVLNGCQFDAHGAGPSTRWVEIYNNSYVSCCASSSDFDWRGGSGLYFNNTTTSRYGSTDTSIGPICGSSDSCGAYPVQYQLGMGIGGFNYSPVYVWGSDYSSTSAHSIQNSMVQLGSSPNDATHCSGLSGNTCNAIVTLTQPATLLRCESAADVSAGCPVSYAYAPYTYPHPMDNCPSATFGTVSGGCSGSAATPPNPPSGLAAIVN